ncbi:hypothetical protein B5M09_009441 [Aphanomyces astaci]|uniref:Uncharacterized protein n=1 Tax=Aphanomyces astaci TaxID=112090 RepID=A0A3R7ZE03_APHAT|nr:hypothetical protein B5M09_009441 [Aphanomyces astaci]
MLSWVKLMTVVALVALSGVDAEDMAKKSKHCKRDHQVCDDGTKVYRNKELHCKFDPCPGDLVDDDLDDNENDYEDEDDVDDESFAVVLFATPIPPPPSTGGIATHDATIVVHPSSVRSTTSPPIGRLHLASINSTNASSAPVNSSLSDATIVAPSHPSTTPDTSPRHTKKHPPANTPEWTKPHSSTLPATTFHATTSPSPATPPLKYHTPPSSHPTAAPTTITIPPPELGWQVVPSAPEHVWAAMNDAFAHYRDNYDVCTLFKAEPVFVETWNGTYHVVAHADCRLRDLVALAGKFSLLLEPPNSVTDKAPALRLTECGWEDRWGVLINWLTVDAKSGVGVCESPHEKARFDAQPLHYVRPPTNETSLSSMAQGVMHDIVQDKTKVAGVALAAGAISALVLVGVATLLCRKRRQRSTDIDDEEAQLEKVPLSSESPTPQEDVEEAKVK